ncbi:hypothetical protein ACVNPX_02115 [Staphylococcus aureus]
MLNKRTATIKNGTAMPTNLAGGSTTTIPTVTYNDGYVATELHSQKRINVS